MLFLSFPFRILFAVLIIFFGYLAFRTELGGYETGLFDFARYTNIILVVILTTIALSLDISSFKRHKKIYYLLPSFIGIITIAAVIFKTLQRSYIDNSKTILEVTHKVPARNDWTFEFKENGYFKLTDNNLLGQTLYYGRYQISVDRIEIKSSNYDGNEKNFPKQGIIRKDTVFWNGSDTMLIKTGE
jgi:hypothetical protein